MHAKTIIYKGARMLLPRLDEYYTCEEHQEYTSTLNYWESLADHFIYSLPRERRHRLCMIHGFGHSYFT